MCPKYISIPISLLQAYFTKMSPFGGSKISLSTLKEDNNALTHRYEAKASGVFTEQHSLNQPGYKVLFSLYSEKKMKYQRNLPQLLRPAVQLVLVAKRGFHKIIVNLTMKEHKKDTQDKAASEEMVDFTVLYCC